MLVDLSGLPAEIDIDESSGTVAVNAAATYGKVAPALDLAGFALHNEGSLPHISAAGGHRHGDARVWVGARDPVHGCAGIGDSRFRRSGPHAQP